MSDKGAPEVGTLALDAKSGRVGRVMDRQGPYVQLRPPQGGTEWEALAADVRRADANEQLRARVAEINANSRGLL
ncbi:hypothetical protein [Streptomyces sp. 8N706]|uniref:hypothetical protein n=1 Tax=Streptomyces sp. 8N706 TaxID=3457416 RepID=UPI003FD6202E